MGWFFKALVGTIFIFFFSFMVVSPIIMKIGYSSVEGSYHAVTHGLLFSLIFIVIICTKMIMEEINELKDKISDRDE